MLAHVLCAAVLTVPGERSPANSGPLEIVLQPRVTLQHSPIFLADVAEVRGPQETLEAFVSLRLGDLPALGYERVVTPAGILLAARLDGLKLEPSQITGAPEALVRGDYATLAAADLERDVREFLREELSRTGDHLILSPSRPLQPVAYLPAGPAPERRVSWVGTPEPHGRVNVRILVSQNGHKLTEQVSPWSVRRFGPVLRLRRPIPTGGRIQTADWIRVEAELTHEPDDLIRNANNLEGLVPRRDLAGFQNLRLSWFVAPLMVRRGDSVLVQTRGPGFSLQVRSTAQQDGRRGQRIQVRNPTSQRKLWVRLIGTSPTGQALAELL